MEEDIQNYSPTVMFRGTPFTRTRTSYTQTNFCNLIIFQTFLHPTPSLCLTTLPFPFCSNIHPFLLTIPPSFEVPLFCLLLTILPLSFTFPSIPPFFRLPTTPLSPFTTVLPPPPLVSLPKHFK